MELLRSLAALVETPSPESAGLARLLDLGDPPTRADHAELFDFQLYPYASVYLGGEGMMGGEARDRIAGFWRALGESPPPEPDHLAVMLALWARLEELESQAEDSVIADRWRHVRAAFLFEQETPRRAKFCDHRTTVDEIERRSGLNFFHGLSEVEQDRLESQPGTLAQNLGCSS